MLGGELRRCRFLHSTIVVIFETKRRTYALVRDKGMHRSFASLRMTIYLMVGRLQCARKRRKSVTPTGCAP
jgi:hypothetical protein